MASLSCRSRLRRTHRRSHRLLPRHRADFAGDGEVPPLPRVGQTPQPYGVYPFLSKWGFINLGNVAGGMSLLFAEALAGVISWSIPAWLFAINRSFLDGVFPSGSGTDQSRCSRDAVWWTSARTCSKFSAGACGCRPSSTPFSAPWESRRGTTRTAPFTPWWPSSTATTSPEAFRAWSLNVFICLLAYDAVRLLIWLDHMGLRVATLVNLSFLGMDRLDERLARFLGPAATARASRKASSGLPPGRRC